MTSTRTQFGQDANGERGRRPVCEIGQHVTSLLVGAEQVLAGRWLCRESRAHLGPLWVDQQGSDQTEQPYKEDQPNSGDQCLISRYCSSSRPDEVFFFLLIGLS